MEQGLKRSKDNFPPEHFRLATLFGDGSAPVDPIPFLRDRLENLTRTVRAFVDDYKGKQEPASVKRSSADLVKAILRYRQIECMHRDLAGLAEAVLVNGDAPEIADIAKLAEAEARTTRFFPRDINKMREYDVIRHAASPEFSGDGLSVWLAETRARRPHLLADEIELYYDRKESVKEAAWCTLYDMTRRKLDDKPNTITEDKVAERAFIALILNTIADIRRVEDVARHFNDAAARPAVERLIDPALQEKAFAKVQDVLPASVHAGYARFAAAEKKSRLTPAEVASANTLLPWQVAFERALSVLDQMSPAMRQAAAAMYAEGRLVVSDGKSRVIACGSLSCVQIRKEDAGDAVALAGILAEAAFHDLSGGHTTRLLTGIMGHLGRGIAASGNVAALYSGLCPVAARFLFEKKFHTERREKGEVDIARISDLWVDAHREIFGAAVDMDDPALRDGWMYCPEIFHTPLASGSELVAALSAFALLARVPELGQGITQAARVLATGGQEAALVALGISHSDDNFMQDACAFLEKTGEVKNVPAKAVGSSKPPKPSV